MGVSQNQGYSFGGPYSKDYNMLGSMLGGPPILGNNNISNGPSLKRTFVSKNSHMLSGSDNGSFGAGVNGM